MATAYAMDQAGAERKKKAIARLRAAQVAAEMLHAATQREGLPESPTPPTPPKPVSPGMVPHTPPRVPGPTPGRPIADPGRVPGAPGYPGAGHPPPRIPPSLVGDALPLHQPGDDASPQGRGQVTGHGQGTPAYNLATGRPYSTRKPPVAGHDSLPPGAHLPGKPNGIHMPERPPFGGPQNGRPIVHQLEEQLAQRQAQQQQRMGVGADQTRRRRRGNGAQLLAQILGGFSRG